MYIYIYTHSPFSSHASDLHLSVPPRAFVNKTPHPLLLWELIGEFFLMSDSLHGSLPRHRANSRDTP